jgi:hypothetical protein
VGLERGPLSLVSTTEELLDTRAVRKIKFPMIFHNEKHVYWH